MDNPGSNLDRLVARGLPGATDEPGTTMLDRALAVAARERHGLITADDLRSIGVSRAQVRSRIENGSLVRVNEHVRAIAGAPVSWAQTSPEAAAYSRRTATLEPGPG